MIKFEHAEVFNLEGAVAGNLVTVYMRKKKL